MAKQLSILILITLLAIGCFHSKKDEPAKETELSVEKRVVHQRDLVIEKEKNDSVKVAAFEEKTLCKPSDVIIDFVIQIEKKWISDTMRLKKWEYTRSWIVET